MPRRRRGPLADGRTPHRSLPLGAQPDPRPLSGADGGDPPGSVRAAAGGIAPGKDPRHGEEDALAHPADPLLPSPRRPGLVDLPVPGGGEGRLRVAGEPAGYVDAVGIAGAEVG